MDESSSLAASVSIIFCFSVLADSDVTRVFRETLLKLVVIVHICVLLVHTIVALVPVLHMVSALSAPLLDDYDDDCRLTGRLLSISTASCDLLLSFMVLFYVSCECLKKALWLDIVAICVLVCYIHVIDLSHQGG